MKKKLKCFVCHKEINEEEDYVFKGQTVHKGVCLKSMIDEYNTIRNLQIRNKRLCSEIDRLNNIINELKWKPIKEYDKGNYDWVLVKYFDGDYECIPCVADKRFGKWYSIDEKEIQFDVKYFMDIQQIDKLKDLKEDNK